MKIAIRADASLGLGSGHVMRTVCLANELRQRGHQVVFFSRRQPGDLLDFLRSAEFQVQELCGTESDDALQTLGALSPDRWDWMVVDHYGLDSHWEGRVRGCCLRVMAVDDLANRDHDVDVLLDVNLHDHPARRYEPRLKRPASLLLGPHYALLRPEFLQTRLAPPPVRDQLLLFFGGADLENYTEFALRVALDADLRGLKVVVVVGRQNPHRTKLQALCQDVERVQMMFAPDDFSRVLAESRLAFCSGGSVTWERCCLGVPALVVAVADNQFELVTTAARHGLHDHLEDLSPASAGQRLENLLSQPDRLREMASRGRELVDGRGAQRVAERLESLSC